jgi:hypothetical protein
VIIAIVIGIILLVFILYLTVLKVVIIAVVKLIPSCIANTFKILHSQVLTIHPHLHKSYLYFTLSNHHSYHMYQETYHTLSPSSFLLILNTTITNILHYLSYSISTHFIYHHFIGFTNLLSFLFLFNSLFNFNNHIV